ncbi:MAG: tRNA (5-methylaminomethyl-2-thiouridylate)-methyltransferase [Candidatus Cloacimonadota bacterium]|nr:MAG: tRNA (5-methylaminomethyl-2-thiouridylate)-methyltransferase [Candidatus Cloacimonadota bacterium]
MKRKHKAVALFSGGLDSILAVKYMQSLGYEVIPVFFDTPFFDSRKTLKYAEINGINLKIIDIATDHLEMLKSPRYGYGKHLNPCIDCHGLMFKKAGETLKIFGADFLISGEVLGQRPMSQRKNAMNSVSKLSGVKDLIVRPLSQKLLKDTLPVTLGWVNKNEMLDIQGRSRHRQLELAEKFNVKVFPSAGGGCLLTDNNFSRRMRDLLEHDFSEKSEISLLKYGRHFRLNKDTKLLVGRTKSDNEGLSELAGERIVLKAKNVTGPLGIISSESDISKETAELAGAIFLSYCGKAKNTDEVLFGKNFALENEMKVTKMKSEQYDCYRI